MKRPPGRPRVDPTDRSIGVHVTVAVKAYDQLWDRARRAGVSVPEVIRRELAIVNKYTKTGH